MHHDPVRLTYIVRYSYFTQCRCNIYLRRVLVFQNKLFLKTSFRNTIRVSNSLDSDHAKHFVGPDLGSYCLQMLSADDTGRVRAKINLQ